MDRSIIFAAILMTAVMAVRPTLAAGDQPRTPAGLTPRQEAIVVISAFTAAGDMDRLKPALHEGLDRGLTVNEIKEILVQLYAYAGFPRSLNAIAAFMTVMDERAARGIKDVMGPESGPPPANWNRDEYGARMRARMVGREDIPPPSGYQVFVPTIDKFLKEHLFADIFARDVLDLVSRELATAAALANLPGLEAQLRVHMTGALNFGLDEAGLRGFARVMGERVGAEAGKRAEGRLEAALGAAKKK